MNDPVLPDSSDAADPARHPLHPPESQWQVVDAQQPHVETATTARICWAEDGTTGRPRHIAELSPRENGAACGCVCASCRQPLIAVNAGKAAYVRRPHFRHLAGTEKDSCAVLAARAAAARLLEEGGLLELPARRLGAAFHGFSGHRYEGWAEHGRERVRIAATRYFRDKARAVLTLDDGRQLLVDLSGEGGLDAQDNPLLAVITVAVNDPALVALPPEAFRERLRLLVHEGCWQSHWNDATLQGRAAGGATRDAEQHLDWLEPQEGEVDEIAPSWRHETLLHREVKAILEREMRVRLPEIAVEVARKSPHTGREHRRSVRLNSQMAALSSVRLETRVGRIVPDIVAERLNPGGAGNISTLLVEVTVANRIDEQRLERIRQEGHAAMEIDLSRFGGRITRDELRRLVVDELAGKRWLHVLAADQIRQRFEAELDAEIEEEARRVQASVPRNRPAPAGPAVALPGVDFQFEQLLPRDLQSWTWLNYRPPPQQARAPIYLAKEIEETALTAPVEALGERLLQGVLKHAHKRIEGRAAVVRDFYDRQEIRAALYEAEIAAEMLARRGYPEARDTALFGGAVSILERLLAIKNDKPVGMRKGGALDVLRAVREETLHPHRPRWHTLYLVALKAYHPGLIDSDAELKAWRDRIYSSLKAGEVWFAREARYDRLLEVLFPPMSKGLRAVLGRW